MSYCAVNEHGKVACLRASSHSSIIKAAAVFQPQTFWITYKVGILVSFPELFCEVNKRDQKKNKDCLCHVQYFCTAFVLAAVGWNDQQNPSVATTKTPAAVTSSLLYIQRNCSKILHITLNWRGALAFVGLSGCTNGRGDVLDIESGYHHKHSAQCYSENIFRIYEA